MPVCDVCISAKALRSVDYSGRLVTGTKVSADSRLHTLGAESRVKDHGAVARRGVVNDKVSVVLERHLDPELVGEIRLIEIDHDKVDPTGIELGLIDKTLKLRRVVGRALAAVSHDESRQTRSSNHLVDVVDVNMGDRQTHLEETGDLGSDAISGESVHGHIHTVFGLDHSADHLRRIADHEEARTLGPGATAGDVVPGSGIGGLVEAIKLDRARKLVGFTEKLLQLLGLQGAVLLARIGDDHRPSIRLKQKCGTVGVRQLFELGDRVIGLEGAYLGGGGAGGVATGAVSGLIGLAADDKQCQQGQRDKLGDGHGGFLPELGASMGHGYGPE